MISIPTPFYLLPLAHPVFAWLVAAAGMLLLTVATRQRKNPPREAVYEAADDEAAE